MAPVLFSLYLADMPDTTANQFGYADEQRNSREEPAPKKDLPLPGKIMATVFLELSKNNLRRICEEKITITGAHHVTLL